MPKSSSDNDLINNAQVDNAGNNSGDNTPVIIANTGTFFACGSEIGGDLTYTINPW